MNLGKKKTAIWRLGLGFGSKVGRHHTIAPLMAKFTDLHPNVSAHLDCSDHVVDLLEKQFDIAIRYGGIRDKHLNVRKLADNSRLLLA